MVVNWVHLLVVAGVLVSVRGYCTPIGGNGFIPYPMKFNVSINHVKEIFKGTGYNEEFRKFWNANQQLLPPKETDLVKQCWENNKLTLTTTNGNLLMDHKQPKVKSNLTKFTIMRSFPLQFAKCGDECESMKADGIHPEWYSSSSAAVEFCAFGEGNDTNSKVNVQAKVNIPRNRKKSGDVNTHSTPDVMDDLACSQLQVDHHFFLLRAFIIKKYSPSIERHAPTEVEYFMANKHHIPTEFNYDVVRMFKELMAQIGYIYGLAIGACFASLVIYVFLSLLDYARGNGNGVR